MMNKRMVASLSLVFGVGFANADIVVAPPSLQAKELPQVGPQSDPRLRSDSPENKIRKRGKAESKQAIQLEGYGEGGSNYVYGELLKLNGSRFEAVIYGAPGKQNPVFVYGEKSGQTYSAWDDAGRRYDLNEIKSQVLD